MLLREMLNFDEIQLTDFPLWIVFSKPRARRAYLQGLGIRKFLMAVESFWIPFVVGVTRICVRVKTQRTIHQKVMNAKFLKICHL